MRFAQDERRALVVGRQAARARLFGAAFVCALAPALGFVPATSALSQPTPLALLGAVLGLRLYGLTVNIFSEIAVIMLIGIAAKNGVLIVEFANQLRDRGVEFVDALVGSAVTRLRPVLMTSLCTAFGALPLLLASGAGAEQRRPIGIVVFYGMLVSVFLTLFAVPTAYAILARKTRSPQHVSRIVDRLLAGGDAAGAAGGTAAAHAAHHE